MPALRGAPAPGDREDSLPPALAQPLAGAGPWWAAGPQRAQVGAGLGWPVTSALPHGSPSAPFGAVVRGPAGQLGGVGGPPAAGGQARDDLRGQPPRDAPQVQLLPQQGLELPAAALGTTKGALAPPAAREGAGGGAVLGLFGIQVGVGGGARQGPGARRRPFSHGPAQEPCDAPVQPGGSG